MTTPGGVPNLPVGALTLDTLASKTQDMTESGMRGRADERVSSIFGSSTGGDVTSDLSPLGIIAKIFSGFNSVVANADPADVQGPEDLPGLLLDFIEGLPVIGQFVDLFEAILGTYTGDDETLLGIQALFAPIRAVADAFPGLLDGLLNGGQPLNVLNLFGQLPEELFGLIPSSSIGSANPNLLNNGGFDGAISMDGEGIWTWDAATGHTTNGAASTTGNSTLKALLSNAISVAEGQKLTPTAWVKTSGYTGTGTPIRLAVRTYLAGTAVATTNIQSIAGPGSTWTQMTGSYTVPSGVDSVRLRLVVDATATGGTIWFDDGSLTKPGDGPFDGILQLFGLSSLEDLFDGLDVNGIWSWIITNVFNPLGLLDIQGVPIIGDIIDAINPGGTGAGDIGTWVTDLLSLLGSPTSVGSGSPTPPDITDRVPIVGGLLDGLFGAWTSIFDIPANQQRVVDSAVGVSQSISSAQAGLAQLQAALSPGNPDQDDFERTNSGNWGSAWLVMEDGNGGDASVDGHNGVWAADYTIDSECVFRKTTNWTTTNPAVASTDNQTCAVVLNSAIGYLTDGNAALDLWLRMSNFTTYATRTGVRFRFWGNKTWQLHAFNAGTGTLLASGTHSASVSSGTFSFEAGQLLTTRRFVAKINSSPIMDFTESGTTSLAGASYRYRGVGIRGEFSLIGLAGFPPAIEIQGPALKQWTATG